MLVVFAITLVFHSVVGLLCNCEGHLHSSEYICVDLHHHDCGEHSECNDHGTAISSVDCIHFKVIELEKEKPNNSVRKSITEQYTTAYSILYNYLCTYNLDEEISSVQKYYDYQNLVIESEWHTSPLWQRPPPTFV